MGDTYSLSTPEYVSIQYNVAGLGSRFMAGMVDIVVQTILLFLLFFAMAILAGVGVAAGVRGFGPADEASLGIWITALFGLVTFATFWGYYIFFEMVWAGQSPGKRAMQIRVIKDTGYPITFMDSFIRNVLRLIDFLPGFYAVGILVMITNSRARRVGDFAAGTIVVKVRRTMTPYSLEGAPTPARPPSSPEARPELLESLGQEKYALVAEYLRRRPQLPSDRREGVAESICATIAPALAAPRLPGESADQYLRRMAEGSSASRAGGATQASGELSPQRRASSPLSQSLTGGQKILLTEYLRRRSELPPERREAVAENICKSIAPALNTPRLPGESADEYLSRIAVE